MPDFRERLQTALAPAYELDRELVGGGMSRVFVATERALGRKVVVKVLSPELSAGVNRERFRREIHLAAQLQHPHIVPLLSAGESGELLYYTMPYIEGESLKAALARRGAFPVRDVVRVMYDVVDALAYAHARGVIHRDIKPGNILTLGSHAVVTDFGVAKALGASLPHHSLGATSAGIALGTPEYMAPEQLAADPAADHRMDLYAVGLLAYELLRGQSPFSGLSPQATLAAQLTRVPVPLDQCCPDVAPELSAVIMQCLAKEPEDRPPNAEALLARIEEVATPQGGVTSRISSATAGPAPAGAPAGALAGARTPVPEEPTIEEFQPRRRLVGPLLALAGVAALATALALNVVATPPEVAQRRRDSARVADSVRAESIAFAQRLKGLAKSGRNRARRDTSGGTTVALRPALTRADSLAIAQDAVRRVLDSVQRAQQAQRAGGEPGLSDRQLSQIEQRLLDSMTRVFGGTTVSGRGGTAVRTVPAPAAPAAPAAPPTQIVRINTDSIVRAAQAEAAAAIAAARSERPERPERREPTERPELAERSERTEQLRRPLPPVAAGRRRIVFFPVSRGSTNGRTVTLHGAPITDSLRRALAGNRLYEVIESTTAQRLVPGADEPSASLGRALGAGAVMRGVTRVQGEVFVIHVDVIPSWRGSTRHIEVRADADNPLARLGELVERVLAALDSEVEWTEPERLRGRLP